MIPVKNAPHIAGLRFRHFRGERDYPQLAAVLNASEAADGTERTVTAEDLAKAYQRLVNCDPYKDMLIAEVAGDVVGYVRGEWEDKNTGRELGDMPLPTKNNFLGLKFKQLNFYLPEMVLLLFCLLPLVGLGDRGTRWLTGLGES